MKRLLAALAAALGLTLLQVAPFAQDISHIRSLSTTSATGTPSLRDSDRTVTELARSGALVPQATFDDVLIPGRHHQRFQQTVNGVPVWASTLTRQTDEAGVAISIFGELYDGLESARTEPKISAEDARHIAANDAGVELGGRVSAPLYMLVTERGPRLVYVVRAAQPGLKVFRYFVDATTGSIVEKRDDGKRQSVGTGSGVFGGDKKISTTQQGGTYVAADALRPPVLDTFNMRGNIVSVDSYLNGLRPLFPSDYASDSDNRWTDAAVVDAHVQSGWTYDYLFKRFGRLGLDNRNLPITNIVHPATFNDFFVYGDVVLDYLINAFYFGDGVMVYGDGLPAGVTLGGQTFDPLSGALDVVAHELTHGVTDYTSQLEYLGESGALNEAFSDMIGTSVEFYFQQPGIARGQADYLIAEDVVRPGGIRSMSNPELFGQPDHYSRLVRTAEDNGGVHINSGIPNHAFYLAIEGGRNRTSGLNVTGVGAANREQIEKVFYRAFTSMLPANARFTTARVATIQAARDLYGAGSAAERAVTEAWTAVGVF
jgi:bacillolysin